MKKIICPIVALALLAACSKNPNVEYKYPKSKDQLEEERIGKLTGDSLFSFGGGVSHSGSAHGMNVNGYVWRASLDAVHFMPVISADPFGGTILTDWYSDENKNERIKFNIFIVDSSLSANAVKVSAFRQVKGANNVWHDAPASSQFARDVEEKIIKKARALKIAAQQ